MNSLRTKKKLRTRITWMFSLVFLCLSVLFFSYTVSELGFAQEPEPDTTEPESNTMEPESNTMEPEQANYLVEGDSIIVTGVANTIEYLTSLYLYVTDPYSTTSVNMRYDPELNALLINSSINANAMGIGFNEFGEGVVGSVFVGGSGNVLKLRGEEIYDEYGDYTGSRNGKNDSSVVIGGEKNRPSPAGSVIVGGRNNTIGFTDSTMIGSTDSNLNGHHSVSLGSKKSGLNVQDWNSINMGTNNHGDKYTYLIGSGINTHGGATWAAAVSSVFAWSPGASGFALHGGGLGGQQGFYVNVKNGFGLNTSTPRLTFDFRSGGPLRVIAATGVIDNAMMFIDGASDGIICEDEFSVQKFRGVLAYVDKDYAAGFCGCNGKTWMPLSSKAIEQSLCAELDVSARKCNGFPDGDPSVILHEETKGQPRWDEDANDGKGAWVELDWTFMGIPSLISGDARECSYTCAVGYHPNKKSAKGWFTGACEACEGLKNGVYITPGTGINDCEFACNGGYKYYKWAENKDDRCTPCDAGEWTEPENQAIECNKCELPIGVSAKSSYMNAGIMFTGGVMWNGTTGTGEPYFRKFVTFSTTNQYGCDFECAPGYAYSFGKAKGLNKCTECAVGTFSNGGNKESCLPCENRKQEPITFSSRDSNGNLYTHTITADEASKYTTKGTNGPESCQWICNPEIGLVKVGDSCKCPNGSHLELIAGKPRCISNIADMSCSGRLPSLAIKGAAIAKGVSAGSINGTHWEPGTVSWRYVNKLPENLGACEFTCPEDYTYEDGECKLPPVGICGSKNGTIVDSLTESDLCTTTMGHDGFTTLSDEIEINYFYHNDKNLFQYYPSEYSTHPVRYLAKWTCKGYKGKPEYSANCFAYVKGEQKNGQCPGEDQWRDIGGKAKAMCVYTPGNCNEEKNCPPLVNKGVTPIIEDSSIDLDNKQPHGLQWACPGTFGGNIAQCHSCDLGFSWWVRKGGCTENVITTTCKGKESSSRYPSSLDYTNFGPEEYTNIFDKSADDYTPGIVYYKRLSDGSNPTNPCEWSCQAGTHFCSSRCYVNPKCGSLSVDGSGNIIKSYLCAEGSYSSVTTGDDGNFKWHCHNGCEYDYCGSESFECYGPIPDNTYYVGKTSGLYESAEYTLYPEDSSHLGEPCSLACAIGYKYSDGKCVKVNPPKCGEPDKGVRNWRSSPQYCQDAFTLGTSDYNNCMAKAYKYCDEGNLNDFSIGGFIGASWKCISGEDGVSREDDAECSASCTPGTDNYDPSYLYLGSSDSNSDSIFIRYGETLDFTGWDTSWLSVSRTYAGGLSGYGMMRFTGSANTGSQRSTTITFTTSDDYFCDTWDLTIVQCQVGYEGKHKPEGGYVCVPKGTYSCSETGIPANSEPAGERFGFTVEPPSNKLYEDKEAAKEIPCSLVCKEGYTFLYAAGSNPDRCEKCEVGTLNPSKTWCQVIVGCATGYTYNKETGGCDIIGDCLWGYGARKEAPRNSIGVVSYDESRPIGGNLSWSCRKNVEDVRAHACEYACEEGYVCGGFLGCGAPQCSVFSESSYGDLNLAVTYENPTYNYAVEVGGGTSPYISWKYQEASSEEDFNNKMKNADGSMREGCWYRCNNGWVELGGLYPKCVDPNTPANAYTCLGSLTGLRDTNIITTDKDAIFTDHNRDWTFVWPRSQYFELAGQGEQCLYTCKTGFELKTFTVGQLCAQTCNSGYQYMTSQGYCSNCYVEYGQFPDKSVMENGNALSCYFVCDPATQTWSETLKACVAKTYYILECPEGMTELGKTDEGQLICGVKFG